MRKISDTVKEILTRDEIALTAYQRGQLNFSAYAQFIQKQVEDLVWKPVTINSLVVALSRLADEVINLPAVRSSLVLDDLSIKSPLSVVSFEKTVANIDNLRQLYKKLHNNPNQFIVATQGSREITIIAPTEYQGMIEDLFNQQPKARFSHLVGISVSFSEQYLSVPNIIYTILSALAVHHVNIIEIVSTHTELTLIINQKELEVATQALQVFFKISD